MIVELHMLQNFAPSCLNRDDTNSPKECQFGGYRRSRISSQCAKRAIRETFRRDLLISPESLANRTKLLHDQVSKRLEKAGKPEDDARKAAAEAINSIGLKLKGGVKSKTEYLVFIGDKEVDAIAETVLAHWSDLLTSKTDEKKLKAIGNKLLEKLDGGKAVDLALFGRMLADIPKKNIDAACQVAHAISTHKVGVEFDYYTAVDDLQPKEEAGAGMIGTVEFNSACYYRYANIDLDQLKNNLGGDVSLTHKAVEAFIRAAVSAIPTGRQTSFAAQNPPDFIMAVVRNSGTWSLANAFARPVREGGDLVADSVAVLVAYWEKLKAAYGSDEIQAEPALALGEAKVETGDRVRTLQELLGKVNKAIGANA